MYAYTSASCSGSPHSSHSITVSGSDGSRIVVSASTNGTSARMPANSSGARLATAPISRPPALPPSATSRSGEVYPLSIRCRAQSTKSVKVLRLLQQLAVLVPLPAHLAAAAHVRDREDDAAVEHRQAGDREAAGRSSARTSRSRTGAAGAAPVAGVAERALPDERDRARCVPSCAVAHSRACVVVRGVVAAEHRLPLAQQQLAASTSS